MQNKLSDLNNYLFAQLERLEDESQSDESLAKEIDRARAITDIAGKIIDTGNVQLKAIKTAHEAGVEISIPKLLLGE